MKIFKDNSIINNWNSQLITAIIDFWARDDKIELPTEEEFEAVLGIQGQNWIMSLIDSESDKCNLLDELKLRVKRASSQCSSMDKDLASKVKHIEKAILLWFQGNRIGEGYMPCLLRLQNNAQKLRLNLKNKSDLFISSHLSEVPPETGLEYLEKLEAHLKKLIYKLEQSKLDCQIQEESAVNAKKWLLETTDENFSAYIRAIFWSYNYKIKAEICSLAIQALLSIVQTIQLHLDKLIQTIALLRRIKNKYSNNINKKFILPIQVLLPFLFEEMSLTFTPEDLKQKLQFQFGYKICDWGVCGTITEERVDEFLSQQVNSISEKLYGRVRSEFLQQNC